MSALRNSGSASIASIGRDRDADADVGDDLVAVDLIGLDDGIADALGQRGGVRGVLHLGHDDGELVAAQARDRVGLARAVAQPLAHQLQQLVADRMAERVIDALELVEVEAEHRQAFAAFDALELVLQRLAQQHAVGQVGQRVVARHVGDLALRALPLGDVFVGGEPAAAGQRLADDREGAPVRQADNVREGLAVGETVLQPDDVIVGIAGKGALLRCAGRAGRAEYRPGRASSAGNRYISR